MGFRVKLHGSNPKPLMSALRQKRTFCAAVRTSLFDHLVGAVTVPLLVTTT